MKRPNIDVSVIICSYEQPLTVRLIIECLLKQTTNARFEIIVCDDGSTGDFFASSRDFIQNTPVPIYWVWQQDDGYNQASNINNGLGIASGKYVIFLDGDMLPERDFIEQHRLAHETPGRLIVGERLWRDLAYVESKLPLSPEDIWPILHGTEAVTPSSKATEWLEKKIQTRRFASAQPWHGGVLCNLSVERSAAVYVDEAFHGWGFEDTEMTYRVAKVQNLEIRFEPAAVAYHLANLISNPWVTRKHDGIVRYLSNLCYFLDKWPDSFDDYTMDLLPFELDPATGTWTTIRVQKKDFATFIDEARSWLRETNQYPQQQPDSVIF